MVSGPCSCCSSVSHKSRQTGEENCTWKAWVRRKMIHCTQRVPEPMTWAARRLRPPLLVQSFFSDCFYRPKNWVGLSLVSLSSNPSKLLLPVPFSAFQEPKIESYYSVSKQQFQDTIKKIILEWFICIQMAAHEGAGQYVVHELSMSNMTA